MTINLHQYINQLLRASFMFMAFLFLIDNLVLPCYEYFKIESTEVSKNLKEDKSEKEKEGEDTDEFVEDFAQNASSLWVSTYDLRHSIANNMFHYADVSTPPPKLG